MHGMAGGGRVLQARALQGRARHGRIGHGGAGQENPDQTGWARFVSRGVRDSFNKVAGFV